jgi:hypothetical protein
MMIFGSRRFAGGFNIGAGFRLTKRNFLWMAVILMFIGIFKLVIMMVILAAWGLYYVCVWPFVKLYQVIKNAIAKRRNAVF